ncbi:MAG TPA: hypothetical protein PL190_00615 [Caldisericia bacterium]|nr:hypothetical protein [Caldisericia bacterium]HNY60616.1 hypothetical protein [Caldisericia bacterium]HOC79258.1 hypothetical protein [Caldisericia bacterium]HOG70058.1 hypothetical protein [Caldisericia bacterium]HPA65026.1 hypothetical protein [Caldisericia bacterium]
MTLANALSWTSGRANGDAIKALLSASAWLSQSGIQEQEGPHAGGFYGWYSTLEHCHSIMFSAATGNAITCMLFLDRMLPGWPRQNPTEQAAFWLLDKAWVADEGGFMVGINPQNDSQVRQIKTLDVAMILNAFVHLHYETDNSFCLSVASKAVDFITQRMMGPNGVPYPLLDVDSATVIQDTSNWRADIQPYLAKISIGLMNYAQAIRSERARTHAIRLLDWACQKAEEKQEGAITSTGRSVHLLPTMYAVDALLVGSVMLDRQRMLEAALKTWRFVADCQLQDGGFPMLVGEGENYERADVCAHFIRAGRLIEALGMLPEGYCLKIDKATKRLCGELANRQPDPKMFGAFNHSGAERPDLQDANTQATMVAIQALSLEAGMPNAASAIARDMLIV